MIEKLNTLLASYQVFQMNAKGFHWNIKGNQFFELHQVYGDLYTDLEGIIDMIAEHIRTFDSTPLHDFYSYCEKSKVTPSMNLNEPQAIAKSIIKSIVSVIDQMEVITEEAQRRNEFATFSIFSEQLSKERKRLWMWTSFSKKI